MVGGKVSYSAPFRRQAKGGYHLRREPAQSTPYLFLEANEHLSRITIHVLVLVCSSVHYSVEDQSYCKRFF